MSDSRLVRRKVGSCVLAGILAVLAAFVLHSREDIRAEFFNLLNHPNFDLPASSGASVFAASGSTLGSAGRIQATVNSSRQIQFGAKLIF